MTIIKSLIPLVLLVALLLVACDQQTAVKTAIKTVDIPEANRASVTFAVDGMT